MSKRGILPDAVNQTDVALIKGCSGLRPTYQVGLATYMAQQTYRRLRIIFPTSGTARSSLTAYARQHNVIIEQRP